MEEKGNKMGTRQSAEAVCAQFHANNLIRLLANFAEDGTLVVNGRKHNRIPFAGTYEGSDAIGAVLGDIFDAIEIKELRPQFTMSDSAGATGSKLVSCCNVVGSVRSTGTEFDLELAVMAILDDKSQVRSARVFYDTDITRRAFEGASASVLRDEKGTGVDDILRDVPYDPHSIVPRIYEVIFEGVPNGTPVKWTDLARSMSEFLQHNIARPPSFWYRLLRDFNLWDLARQSAELRRYYSPDLLHMIKGGETAVGLCGTYHGYRGLSDFALRLFSELEYEGIPPQLETIAEGNRCAVHMPETFVNKATGTRAVVHMLHLWRFDEDGKVVEFKSYNDTFEIVDSYGLASEERGRHDS